MSAIAMGGGGWLARAENEVVAPHLNRPRPADIKPEAYYTVTNEDVSLGVIAARLYGDPNLWHDLASWNGMIAPYYVRAGQKLALARKPTLTPQQGEKAVLQLWSKHFGVELEKDPALAREPEPYRKADAVWRDEVEKQPEVPHGAIAFEKAQIYWKRNQPAKAAEFFRESRTQDPALLGALRKLGRKDELKTTVHRLLELHPELKDLPALKIEPAKP
jgi:hypothetical protein